MALRSGLVMAAGISASFLWLHTGADARDFGGGHFGGDFGGHFGGMRDFGGGVRAARPELGPAFRPEFQPEARPEVRPELRPQIYEPRLEEARPRIEERRDAVEDRARIGRGHDADDRSAERSRIDHERSGDHNTLERPDVDRRANGHIVRPEGREGIGERRPDDRNLDRHEDFAQHGNNLRQPVNAGRWSRNVFWHDNWKPRHFTCANCRWGWVGPVFWPFALGDMWSFAWWPYAPTAPFWDYGVDYIMGGLFWPNGAYPWPSGGYGATAWTQSDDNYAYAHSSHEDIYSGGQADDSDSSVATAESASRSSVADDSRKVSLGICSGYAPGVTALPIDRIEAQVRPSGDQLSELKVLQAASNKAEDILGNSCPTSPPLTPVGRLDALQKRLDAMVQGLELVRGPLAKFDGSLSPEQRRQLDALGGSGERKVAKLCGSRNEEFVNVPTREIIATVDPDKKQKAALDQLDNVSAKAAVMLQSTCPAQIPNSTEARLDAMGKRLKATITAMSEVRPALAGFYDSLSDEQKARFNTMPGH